MTATSNSFKSLTLTAYSSCFGSIIVQIGAFYPVLSTLKNREQSRNKKALALVNTLLDETHPETKKISKFLHLFNCGLLK